ncbi:hypothetical protein HHI36_012204, partial [Cryptolaemus montrouzieri]
IDETDNLLWVEIYLPGRHYALYWTPNKVGRDKLKNPVEESRENCEWSSTRQSHHPSYDCPQSVSTGNIT